MIRRRLWVFLVAAPLFAAFLVGIKVFYSMRIWTYNGPVAEFRISPGETFANINHKLASKGIISSPRIFHRYCQFSDILTKFKAGRYLIKPGFNMFDVVDSLVYGTPLGIELTIPEGKNIFEIGKILKNKGIVDHQEFVRLAKSSRMTSIFKIPNDRMEGYLYPDTYRFDKNTPAKKIIEAMVHVFNERIKKVDFSSSFLNKHQVIILASIVEKETGAKWERPIIAGVFHNRLKKGMRLQSDPTTIYGIFENFNGNLRKRHLLQKTPYNTYKIKGLPHGPISNPGLASINAVLNPKRHNYLYFVSKNDGTHVFTPTYKEHLKAVEEHQKKRKNRLGKSWRDLKQN
ncbi:MAG: endolytic transglycosylase MltG [Halobacteriovoraceae bacterium]|nr:endolytic transglycosylase MltG [Halobacteriovoraceae bacterium]